jgi:hypothetical protein
MTIKLLEKRKGVIYGDNTAKIGLVHGLPCRPLIALYPSIGNGGYEAIVA